MQLVIADPTTGARLPGQEDRLTFPCEARESTTAFDLPVGPHALSLLAFDYVARQLSAISVGLSASARDGGCWPP